MSNLTRHTFHKSIKPRIQTENLANNAHKQFYVPLNTKQVKLYTYPDLLKENALLRKLLDSESTGSFLDETFYHTHILLFSMTILAAIVMKATRYSTYCIIHNSYEVATKSSIISTENVMLSYLVGSVDENNLYCHMTCTFIDHAVRHK